MVASIFPGLERALDLTNLAELPLLARYATPAQIRHAGRARVVAYLRRAGVASDRAARIATAAVDATQR
ncbi:hypothetical protein [Actinopolymorpha pittospori]|uniref:Endonuclease III n=1 Tax=Actinopolymorpha pittospori TaxID=648752 RepID=A0A927R911_9ACTN|nr:hypothetical protein [Actinopolymorpha pittospori]MBE1603525.1 endonuclease III [Actinopolymorpha pittospori]